MDLITSLLARKIIKVITKTGNAIASLDEAQKVVEFTNGASDYTYTLPQNSDVAFPIGSWMEIRKTGTGDITITKGTGATFRGVEGDVNIKIDGEDGYSVFVEKTAINTWLISGNITT